MYALNVFESIGEYGTTQRLSTSISVDYRRYCGYPSLPMIVSQSISLRYRYARRIITYYYRAINVLLLGKVNIFDRHL